MIGILNAYHFDPTPGNFQEKYNQLICDYVRRTFPSQMVREYKVALGDWPITFDECGVWIITGSAKGTYEDLEWISKLKQVILALNERQQKIIGICFGHQIISQALGAKVEKSPKGWGVGIKTFSIIKPQSWMKPSQIKLSLLFSHQDQVMSLPEGALQLADSDFCPIQMLKIGENILAFQGHPEFSLEFAKERLISRRDKMPAETFDEAMKSFSNIQDHLLSAQILSSWIRNFSAENKK